MWARGWHAAVTALVVIALVLQIAIAVRVSGVPPDVSTGFVPGSSLAGRIIRVVSFFTILSNLLSGIVCAQLAHRPDRDGPAWRPLRLAALVGVTVTGIVYSTVLAAIHQPNGHRRGHGEHDRADVVPVMTVAGWLLFGPRPRIDRRADRLVAAVPGALAGAHAHPRRDLGVVPVSVRGRDRVRARGSR